ncbi:MAG TPA: IPT/TIG domain-containing protein [Terriglobales bacterium]|nr:IPT/TIG domain-containing protein [Terriglobales bacterium]
MKTICLFLLLSLAVGCGYSSNGSGTVAPGAPTIASLAPNSTAMGGTAFTMTVNGTGFASGAVVYWSGTSRTTMFVSSTKLTAAITAADIGTAQTVLVYVKNPGGTGIYMNQGGQSSASVNFTVTP